MNRNSRKSRGRRKRRSPERRRSKRVKHSRVSKKRSRRNSKRLKRSRQKGGWCWSGRNTNRVGIDYMVDTIRIEHESDRDGDQSVYWNEGGNDVEAAVEVILTNPKVFKVYTGLRPRESIFIIHPNNQQVLAREERQGNFNINPIDLPPGIWEWNGVWSREADNKDYFKLTGIFVNNFGIIKGVLSVTGNGWSKGRDIASDYFNYFRSRNN